MRLAFSLTPFGGEPVRFAPRFLAQDKKPRTKARGVVTMTTSLNKKATAPEKMQPLIRTVTILRPSNQNGSVRVLNSALVSPQCGKA